ncbi:metallophosphoesterase [Actinomycetospora endophytica]|uniref:Metallophosphoesterase n=1 Tax=Actinomycetospora endophytica TaxID=2291215 RepID=A0ABS8P5Q4_9PSEU|nr:metallophosphoesterase [Actinomycetospora endophytica]MCD2193459.1 metallophosphoesterase [Actinomycetospora endophytica]
MIRTAAAGAAAGALGLGYASVVERHWFTLRHATLPVLSPGSRPLRVLHVSDLHLRPGQRTEERFVAGLAELEPDLVVNTGDNLSHRRAVPVVLRALGRLLDRPGVFVFGSNDYHGPRPKNPANYLFRPQHRILGPDLPWRDLRAAFIEHGWHDATHTRLELTVAGQRIAVAGVDDPHIGHDDYDRIAGPADPDDDGPATDGGPTLRLGLTHSPEPRVLDGFAADGYDLVLAGHTHGGQLRLPGYGAIVTNCGVDRSRARGASRWGAHMRLHVSAGLGTSPYAPVRFGCRPEASLLELVPREVTGPDATAAAGAPASTRPPSRPAGSAR